MSTTRESWQEVAWSEREREVISLIGRGRTNSEIAEELGISFATAKWHVREVISKLGVSCREEVAEYWREQQGLGARWRRLRKAMAVLPVVKLGLGGTAAAAGLGVGVLVAGSWVAGGGLDRAYSSQERPETPTITAIASPTPEPQVITVPDGCPTSSIDGPDGLPCDWRMYPEVLALTDGGTCDLSGATLTEANLLHIDLRGCVLESASIHAGAVGADLSFVQATNAVFHQGTFGAVDFRGADLRGTIFRSIPLSYADFSEANLEGAVFEDVYLNGTTWRNTICPDGSNSDDHGGTCRWTAGIHELGETTRPDEAVCPDSDPNEDAWSPCPRDVYPVLAAAGTGEVCDLRGIDLSGADLAFADLRGCDLQGTALANADLTGAWMQGANLEGANLGHASMMRTQLAGANLRDVILDGAYMKYADLRDADLSGARLHGVGATAPLWMNSVCPDGTNSDEEDGDRETCSNNMR